MAGDAFSAEMHCCAVARPQLAEPQEKKLIVPMWPGDPHARQRGVKLPNARASERPCDGLLVGAEGVITVIMPCAAVGSPTFGGVRAAGGEVPRRRWGGGAGAIR